MLHYLFYKRKISFFLYCFPFLVLIFQPTVCIAQNRQIELNRKELLSSVPIITIDTADKALRIATFLFNSKEFQDSLQNRDFKYSNHCKNCRKGVRNRRERIPSTVVFDSLFRYRSASLSLHVDEVGKEPSEKDCYGLGSTCPGEHTINSFYKNIMCDMGEELPFSYAYAVHLCHEYMHDVGYCHTDHVDDVAETVGLIAYYFIKKWYQEGNSGLIEAAN